MINKDSDNHRSTVIFRLYQHISTVVLLLCCTSLFAATFSSTKLPPHTPVPGGIAVIKLSNDLIPENTTAIAHYRGTRALLLSPAETGTSHWHAVIGITLKAKPGKHHITLDSDRQSQHSISFTVEPKTYEEQRITLTNKRQVNPLTNDLERIRREKQIMVAAFRNWNTSITPSMILAKPTIGPISSPFGLRRFFNDQPRNPHSGLDIAAPEGTPIQAPAEAIVVATGDYFFNGQTVLLDHGHGLVSMYCHMNRIDVTEGDRVHLNDNIGLVGKTGRVTGAHLHWSVSLNNARIDPNLLMQKKAATSHLTP